MSAAEPRRDALVVGALQRLRLEAATANVVRAFTDSGVQIILLKGASFAEWLYAEGPPRSFSDCDLLVRPQDRERARQVLVELGFEPDVDEQAMPDWWGDHATGWLRRRDGAMVDLHRTLLGVGVGPDDLWSVLAANLETLMVGGEPVATLPVPGRAFHLALHVAQHGGWPLGELQRAIEMTPDAIWEQAASLAEQLEASAAFAAGLRALPAGEELARRLGLDEALPVGVSLRAAHAPPVALGFEQLASAPDLRARLTILRYKTIPPPTFMRIWSARARQGRMGLILAYAWRPVWLVSRAPAGFRAWRRARRRAGS